MVAMFRLKSVTISEHGNQEYFGQKLVRWSTLVASAVCVMVAMFRLKSVTISDHGNQEFFGQKLDALAVGGQHF